MHKYRHDCQRVQDILSMALTITDSHIVRALWSPAVASDHIQQQMSQHCTLPHTATQATALLAHLSYDNQVAGTLLLQAFTLYTHAGPAGAAPLKNPSTGLPYTHWQYWLHCSADNFGGNKPSGYDITSLRLNLLQQMYDADPAAFHYPDPEAPKVHFKQTRPLQEAVIGIVAVSPNTQDNPHLKEVTQEVLQELQDIFNYGSQQVFLNHVSTSNACRP